MVKNFDGAISSLLSAALALRAGGDGVAARGAEVTPALFELQLLIYFLQALAVQIRGDRDAAQVVVARTQRDYVSCKVLQPEFILYFIKSYFVI